MQLWVNIGWDILFIYERIYIVLSKLKSMKNISIPIVHIELGQGGKKPKKK
jgi:hypothetical protein